MKRLILLLSILACASSYGQDVRGDRIIANKGLFPPVFDTLVAPQREGELHYRVQDAGLYMAISMTATKKWEKMMKAKDSLTISNPTGYVTASILADSAAQLRASLVGGSGWSVEQTQDAIQSMFPLLSYNDGSNSFDLTSQLANRVLAGPVSGGAAAPTYRALVAADIPALTFLGDVTGSQSATVVGKINGVSLAALGTGILKNTTGTGVPSIAIAIDFPTLNQNTTGSAASLTTSRNIYGGAFNGTADLTGIIASTYGGTGNGFIKFAGASVSEKTYTLPNASTTILTTNYTGALATGILKNTTTSGALSIAVAADFPTLNQNTTGSAATLTTARDLYGFSFNGSAGTVSGVDIIASGFGGTGNGFTKFTGATTSEKTYTLPNASTTILTTNAVITIAQGGTNNASLSVAAGTVYYGDGTKLVGLGIGSAGEVLTVNSGATAPEWSAIGGTGTVTSVSFTGGLISVANATTTPALTVAGTSGGIPYFSSSSTWASSAALAANAIVIGGGAGAAPSTTTTGTGVLTALGVNVGSAGAFVTFNGALGTPSSGTLTNTTGLPEGGLSLTDITTANTSTSAHGFFPKLTANSVYYVNNSGALTALTVGASGTVLTGNGTTSAPTWSAPATNGTVTSVSFTGGLISVATATTTPALTVAGTSGGIPYFSSASTWASSAALAANAIVIGGGAGAAPSTTTTGTGVLTALGVNVGSAGAFVTFNGALGTPSSGTVTNLTGTASININGTVGATTPAAGTFTTATANSFVPNSSTIPTNGLYLPAASTLGWGIASAAEMQLTSTALSPAVDGGSSFGTTTLGWQNLFANTGFVINIENSNWVATHTSGILTVGTGDLRVTTAGTNSASVVTVGGTQTLTNKDLTSGTNTFPTFNQNTTGSAATLTTARNINGVAFNGSADITVTAAAGTLTGATLASGVTASSLTSVGTISSGTWNGTIIGKAYGGTGEDNSTGGTQNTFWARPNGSTGAASYRAIVAADIPTLNQNTTGSAATLTTSRNINGVAFNGSADITVTAAAGTLTGTTLNSSVVTSSLTTVGTIGSGTWQGGVISSTYGGTGVNNGGRTLTLNTNSGTFSFGAASKTLTINNSISISGTDGTTMTFPTTTATIARTDAAQTFTGVQTFSSAPVIGSITNTGTLTLPTVTGTLIQQAESTDASTATPTPTGDAKLNLYSLTAAATAPTFAAPSGTPANWNQLLIRIKDNGTARALSWNAIYRASPDLALPTTTVVNKTMYLKFVYNSADSKWDFLAYLDNFSIWPLFIVVGGFKRRRRNNKYKKAA